MSVHVPTFVQSRLDKGVYMYFLSPIEVLFVYLPDYDSPCIRADSWLMREGASLWNVEGECLKGRLLDFQSGP